MCDPGSDAALVLGRAGDVAAALEHDSIDGVAAVVVVLPGATNKGAAREDGREGAARLLAMVVDKTIAPAIADLARYGGGTRNNGGIGAGVAQKRERANARPGAALGAGAHWC